MKIKIVAVSMLAATLALTACSITRNSPVAPEPTETHSSSQGEFTVKEVTDTSEFNNDFVNSVMILDSHKIVLFVGGSGSCPPAPASVEAKGDTVLITAMTYEGKACTMDYRMYAYQIENNSFDFTNKNFELCQYGRCDKLEVTLEGLKLKLENS